MNKQSGIGLSEILISLFLTSLIMTLLTQLYLSNKRQYVEAQKKLESSFDLQWVSDLLSDSIRRAGFTPCLGITQLRTVDRRDVRRTVLGIKMEFNPQQIIQVNRMNERFSKVINIKNPNQLVVSTDNSFNELHPILIADCDHAEIHQIFRIDKIEKNYYITLTKSLMFAYSSSTYIGEWFEEKWFIKKNSKEVKTLHYKLFHTEELTSLVHSLHMNKNQVNEKQLVEVVMGLDNNKTQKLVVAVRGS